MYIHGLHLTIVFTTLFEYSTVRFGNSTNAEHPLHGQPTKSHTKILNKNQIFSSFSEQCEHNKQQMNQQEQSGSRQFGQQRSGAVKMHFITDSFRHTYTVHVYVLVWVCRDPDVLNHIQASIYLPK